MKKMSFELPIESLSVMGLQATGDQSISIEERVLLTDGFAAWIRENKPTIGAMVKVTVELI